MNPRDLPTTATAAPYLVPFEQIERMAAAVAKSGLFGMKTTEQALALMLISQAEGQHPATITQDYDIIQGRAARKTNSVLARFQAAGGSVEWHELSAAKAEATFTPPARAGKPLRITWTIEQARAAGIAGKDNWKNYPRAMLRARCIAEGVRAVYPGAIGGMLVSEEAQDLHEKDVTDTGSHEIQMPREKPEPEKPAEQAQAGEVLPPQAAATTDSPPAKQSQIDLIRKKAAQVEIALERIAERFNLEMVDGDCLQGITTAQGNDILQFIRNPQ